MQILGKAWQILLLLTLLSFGITREGFIPCEDLCRQYILLEEFSLELSRNSPCMCQAVTGSAVPLPLALLMFPWLLPTGLIGNIYLNDSPLKKFRIYSLDMKKSFFQRWVPTP